MLRTLLLVALVSGAAALKIDAAATRRSVVQKAFAAAPLAVATKAMAITPQEAANRSMRDGGKALGSKPFVGTYSDPAHDGCQRTIAYIGDRTYLIQGADEDKKPWKVTAKNTGSSKLLVDFTPKGGPDKVPAQQLPKSGDIKFPDGNVWKKLA